MGIVVRIHSPLRKHFGVISCSREQIRATSYEFAKNIVLFEQLLPFSFFFEGVRHQHEIVFRRRLTLPIFQVVFVLVLFSFLTGSLLYSLKKK
ncbi:MAG: hypothetical protein CMC97_02295, partial [Flavobacteriales bacterium]|nr:hypothetical protein [Flavobacteriales bacterium]